MNFLIFKILINSYDCSDDLKKQHNHVVIQTNWTDHNSNMIEVQVVPQLYQQAPLIIANPQNILVDRNNIIHTNYSTPASNLEENESNSQNVINQDLPCYCPKNPSDIIIQTIPRNQNTANENMISDKFNNFNPLLEHNHPVCSSVETTDSSSLNYNLGDKTNEMITSQNMGSSYQDNQNQNKEYDHEIQKINNNHDQIHLIQPIFENINIFWVKIYGYYQNLPKGFFFLKCYKINNVLITNCEISETYYKSDIPFFTEQNSKDKSEVLWSLRENGRIIEFKETCSLRLLFYDRRGDFCKEQKIKCYLKDNELSCYANISLNSDCYGMFLSPYSFKFFLCY